MRLICMKLMERIKENQHLGLDIMGRKMQTNMMTISGEHAVQERGCYTVEELMDILCVGRKAIYSLIHKKAFPALRIGSVGYRIPKASFHAWMNQVK